LWSFGLARVLGVGDVLEPDRGFRGVVCGFDHGDVLHPAVGGAGVEVLFAGRGVDRLAGVHLDDGSVALAEAGDALRDAEVLAAGVGVPGGARSGGEADGGDDHTLVSLVRNGNGVEPYVPGELLGRVLDGGLLRFDLHGFDRTLAGNGVAGTGMSPLVRDSLNSRAGCCLEDMTDNDDTASTSTSTSTSTESAMQKMVGDFAPKFVSLTDDMLFGDIWARPELSPRDRSLITIASLITGGNTEQQAAHMALGQKNGLTATEIKETIIHMAFYAGWPKAVSALAIAKDTLTD
jgi:4-carboxymuconolactone decarboxylase